MKKEKKELYKNNISVGIHTISGVTDAIVDTIPPNVANAITACNNRKKRKKEQIESYLQLNVNKLLADGIIISNYQEFERNLMIILNSCGVDIEQYQIKRADFCINSTDCNDYERFRKLHKLLICCLADRYSFRNCYQTFDLWQFKSLNVAIRNDSYEAENYNKELENPNDSTKNRFEIRSKKIANSDLKHEFCNVWIDKLKESLNSFEAVQRRYNDNLERLYKKDQAKDSKQRQYLSLNSFLMIYKDCIFTSRQMIDLLARFDEVRNPENKARNFKNEHNIEYFSKADLNFMVDTIQEKIINYFADSEEGKNQKCIKF